MPTPAKPRGTAVRKRPQQARSQITVDYILSAAARLLEQDGYDGTNTNRIAETAGISVGSLYQYFPSKDAIINELFEREHRRYLDSIDTRLAEAAAGSREDAIRALVRVTGELFTKQRFLLRTLAERLSSPGRINRIFELRMALVEVLRQHIDRQVASRGNDAATKSSKAGPIDSSLLAFVLGNTISGMYSAYAMAPTQSAIPSLEVIEEELVRLVASYLGELHNSQGCGAQSSASAPAPAPASCPSLI